MATIHPKIVALALLLLSGAARADNGAPVQGALLFAGGELRFDNAPVWNRFIDLAGGKDAPIVVIPAAATNPRRSGATVVANLIRYGARAELVPIAPMLRDNDSRDAASNPSYVEKLRKARGIWFLGGTQRRITQALFTRDGGMTPALQAIWEAYRKGAVIGGSSAGTAIMSRVMFADALSSLDTIKHGIIRGTHVDVGLGFIGGDWFVDQHFLTRGRFARALNAMRDFGFKYGIGVDEDTAVVYKNGKFTVVGYKGALVLDISGAEIDRGLPIFNMRKARLTYLDAGDSMDARTREVTVSKFKAADQKIDPRDKNFSPFFDQPEDFYFADMLSTWAIYQAMSHALDSKPGVVKGMAFAQPEGGGKNDLGFEFKVYRGTDTVGWFTAGGGNGRYSVLNAYVDITPVQLSHPLYRPFQKSR